MNKTHTDPQRAARTRGAVLYTRVSTGEQASAGTSLDSQTDACRQKALTLGLPIIAECEDAGVSGAFLLSRPGMQAALTLIREGKADTLICANISRYSRDREHQAAIKREVKAAGGRLVFCDMDFDDTPQGDLAFNIMGDFAQFEKAVIKERTYGGLVSRARSGIQPSRMTSPYGYRIVTHADIIRGEYPAESVGQYQVIEAQAGHVRWLFAAYAAGTHSLSSLAVALNAQGVPPPGRAKHWQFTTLRYLLSNQVYKGVAVYGKFDHETREERLQQRHPVTGALLTTMQQRREADPATWIVIPCPALVSEDVWEGVQVRLRENQAKKSGNPKRVSMLAGRVVCPRCGASLLCTGDQTRPSRTPGKPPSHSPARYLCRRYVQGRARTRTQECQPTGYLKTWLEGAVLAALESASQEPEWVQAALATYAQPEPQEARPDALRRELTALEKAIDGVKAQEGATVKAQIAGIIAGASPDAYAEAFASLSARRKDLEDRRGAVSAALRSLGKERSGKPGVPDFAAILGEVRRVLKAEILTGAEKRDVIAPVIAKVVPHRGGEAGAAESVEVYFAPGLLGEGLSFGEGMSAEDTLKTSSIVLCETQDVR